jgi:hypothetical protein
MDTNTYLNEVPISIHGHGLMAMSKLDGQPLAYFTANGTKGPHY